MFRKEFISGEGVERGGCDIRLLIMRAEVERGGCDIRLYIMRAEVERGGCANGLLIMRGEDVITLYLLVGDLG